MLAKDADTTIFGLADQYGVPSWVLTGLRAARGHAVVDAPPQEGSFPVVLFSPGIGSSRWLASSWAADLASHGVIVVAVDHPYDAAAVSLADGTVARSELIATGDDERDRENADQSARVRADDLSAVLDALVALQPDTPALASADFTRSVVAGHSLGGAAALMAAEADTRFDGVVVVDGMPRSPAVSRAVPTVVLVAGDADSNPAYDAATDELVAAGSTRVIVDGVAHLGFTDAALVLAPIPGVLGVRAGDGPGIAAQAILAVVDAVENGTDVDTAMLAELGVIG
ncbi:alpha/beta fold hydrolase [Agromyces sp. NPDC058064]|uniref:alpha/beta fold hydrolase n=1 Tax=Agromyces sp. NPDC058064 TaxID=3346322 RepID=UPI0036DAE384